MKHDPITKNIGTFNKVSTRFKYDSSESAVTSHRWTKNVRCLHARQQCKKNFTNPTCMTVFSVTLCCAFMSSQLIFQLKKLNEIYIVSLTLYKISNHFKLINYLKGRINLKEHLSVMLINIKQFTNASRLLFRHHRSNFKLISNNIVSNFS